MVNQKTRVGIFFVLSFLLFFLGCQLVHFYMKKEPRIKPEYVYIAVGIGFTGVLIALYYLGNVNGTSENFWDVSKYALCKGGAYMYQGDSETAQMCQALAETPEGRCGISSYNCPVGFNGQPNLPFYYTPLSNDDWEDERTLDIPTCKCKDAGLTSFIAQDKM